jgi:membrane carboxypeptidase/penicillin-binding protein PbpC
MKMWRDGNEKLFTDKQKNYWVEMGCWEGVFKLVEGKWSVWVDGNELSPNLISHSVAVKVADFWKSVGYNNVEIKRELKESV